MFAGFKRPKLTYKISKKFKKKGIINLKHNDFGLQKTLLE